MLARRLGDRRARANLQEKLMHLITQSLRRYVPLTVLALAGAGCDLKDPAVTATPPTAVQVSKPVERNVTDYQVFTARTEAVQSVDIKSRVTGYLTKILFKDGDEVKEGSVLFEIDNRPYKATLDQAKANLEIAKASLIKAQAEYDIGLAVQKQDKAAISVQELTKRLGGRDEASANVDKSKALLENAQLNYDWCKVTSPLTGRINRHLVDVGNLVNQDTTLLTNIVTMRPIWAYFDVDQNTMRRYQELVAKGVVKAARDTQIPVQMGVGAEKGFPIMGVIDFLSNQVDPNTGSVRVRAVFPNDDKTPLLPGVFTRIRVPVNAPHDALLVSELAIGTNQGQKFLMLVNEKNEVEYRAVELGQLHDGLREVLRTRRFTETDSVGKETTKEVEVLTANDRVIVNGLQRVRPGATVEPKLVDMQTLK
jgi:RND family efflux transporter MFP subunit